MSVASVLGVRPLNIQFRQALIGDKGPEWVHLLQRLMMVNLSQDDDSFGWKLTNSGVFFVKSMYADIINNVRVFISKYIW